MCKMAASHLYLTGGSFQFPLVNSIYTLSNHNCAYSANRFGNCHKLLTTAFLFNRNRFL